MRMMLASLFVAAAGLSGAAAHAADAPAGESTAQTYSTAETSLGDLLDDPAAKAVLEKHIPSIVNGQGVDMARGMTLTALQSYAADQLTDEKLAAIDADLKKLSHK